MYISYYFRFTLENPIESENACFYIYYLKIILQAWPQVPLKSLVGHQKMQIWSICLCCGRQLVTTRTFSGHIFCYGSHKINPCWNNRIKYFNTLFWEEHPTSCSSKKVFPINFHLAGKIWGTPEFKKINMTYKLWYTNLFNWKIMFISAKW